MSHDVELEYMYEQMVLNAQTGETAGVAPDLAQVRAKGLVIDHGLPIQICSSIEERVNGAINKAVNKTNREIAYTLISKLHGNPALLAASNMGKAQRFAFLKKVLAEFGISGHEFDAMDKDIFQQAIAGE